MNLEIIKIIKETADTSTLILVDQEDRGRSFDYQPGQYLTFRFDSLAKKPIVRSYTMSSSPCEGNFSAITVKEVSDGFVSSYLTKDVNVGDILRARGPIGKFCYHHKKDHKHLAMIAAGSGVTPFVSILREYAPHLGKDSYPEKMSLLVSFRSKKDLICWHTLDSLQKNTNIQIYTTLSREHCEEEGFWYGRINTDHIDKAFSNDYEGTTFMTCGPEEMMTLVANHMLGKGVLPEHMRTESFAN